MHVWVSQLSPKLQRKISSYRAGFMPEERREIERRLASGDLLGVISTSALEMGIDIGYLDICILVGYPGTIINTWQRGGRVGRSGRDSMIHWTSTTMASTAPVTRANSCCRKLPARGTPCLIRISLAVQQIPARLIPSAPFDFASSTILGSCAAATIISDNSGS